ncbi:MAG: winged helix-turn-helix domain-containing protein [Chloroflexi bacterium]|nr:winged helix-turn-helix domain-containing protein [Chloroflexota bacterium]
MLDTEVAFFRTATLDRLQHEFPGFAQRVIEELAMLVGRSRRMRAQHASAPVIARLAAFLLDYGLTDAGTEHETAVALTLTQRDLALLLDTTRETINRALVELSRASFVATGSGHVRILRPDSLRALVASY